MSSIKGQIQKRSIVIFSVMFLVGIVIVAAILRIQSKKELLSQKVENSLIFEDKVDALRGNIYSDDGKSLLATSVPYYYLGIDPKSANDDLFNSSIDSLCFLLSRHVGGRSKQEYKELIWRARKKSKTRYVRLINRRVTHTEKELIETFPLFREGSRRGGGLLSVVPTRSHPFNTLAMRTVGSLDPETKSRGLFGIEYSFNEDLAGKNGKALVKRLAGGIKVPLESGENVEAIDGHDVVTTIDVNFQDIVESALRKKVEETGAKYGSAIVMEIASGQVKAISNLSRRNRNGHYEYYEDINHAIVSATDPGSTFKLASLMAVIDKAGIGLDEYAGNCTGVLMHHGTRFTCDHVHGDITVREVLEKSCNIGVYKLIERVFGMNGIDNYAEYLHKYKLDEAIGFQLKGEKKPYFKNSKDPSYSKTTLPWMSIGYESRISPLQMLAFYNAVANDGYWVEPYLVKEIRNGNQVVRTYNNRKAESRMVDSDVILAAKKMLEGVVENGTGQSIKSGFCKVAGKTGTAQKLGSEGYNKGGKFYTSFIGYFPADNPKYSCAIVIDEPQGTGMYASKVCAPVFRDIADKVFAYDVKIHPVQHPKGNQALIARQEHAGHADDFNEIAEVLHLPKAPEGVVLVRAVHHNASAVDWETVDDTGNKMPDVMGMTLRDALPLLENKGYKVRYSGLGKVREFSLSQNGVVNLSLN
ncbi:hypothetical protein LAG90_10805 [Marinilongibacter aquaticus]|uniref:penicillin-binding transpeptidase domain-containing protein n=1 Tax=Marinilongibacter aquaticus TaxID=2975157 RepID=UPI0021BD5BC6|nr:penicillin-binding transpeptidase domain-containing protein [Marinilongibacter aquaticus]UBM57308.1 hypothetical protein LAG90_10805 [Marinilongibacter aquaticus]